MSDFATSNLSKIKPKFRTQGRVSGNFGKNKVRAGANNELGLSDKEFINVVTQDEYLYRMYQAFDKAETERLRQFCYTQIRDILIQRGIWGDA